MGLDDDALSMLPFSFHRSIATMRLAPLLSIVIYATSSIPTVASFLVNHGKPRASLLGRAAASPQIAVPVSQLEQNLTSSERSITNVVRNCGKSVAFVNTILLQPSRRSTTNSKSNDKLPPGSRSLGAGSGFVVDAAGYIVTNFHVIERVYMLQQMQNNNITKLLENWLLPSTSIPRAQVYVRMDNDSQYQKCRVVDVKPDLDVAVLKIVDNNNSTTSSLSPLNFGSSSSLLVGQSTIAIGNPFGLDTSVTSGVVSALNRELSVSSSSTNNKIRNCIQTDASINPGNSGGPLLNLNGEVIGVNTAIVTTSGSSAGVGFAIPSDEVQPVVSEMIRKDLMKQSKLGWLGVEIVKPMTSGIFQNKNWIAAVQANSPAKAAGMQALSFSSNDGRLQLGDCIVAIGGNELTNLDELRQELESRKRGEELAVTLENATGERRVVYLKLGTMPSSDEMNESI